jgi:hypothetical protein
MLSLIPAILLLAFHGPTAVERFGHEGRLPEALRALERVWTPSESGGFPGSLSTQRKALANLAALTADPEFSKAVSQLFGIELDSDRMDPADPTDLTDEVQSPIGELENTAVQDGFSDCRRTRDGPLA